MIPALWRVENSMPPGRPVLHRVFSVLDESPFRGLGRETLPGISISGATNGDDEVQVGLHSLPAASDAYFQHVACYSNKLTSPAPRRMISGVSSMREMTLEGSPDTVLPSMTAST